MWTSVSPCFTGRFDLCGCAVPACTLAVPDGPQCAGCQSLICHDCRLDPDIGNSICKHCDAFVCEIGECQHDPEHDFACDMCADPACLQCGVLLP
jgi:hypothetical protein